MTQAGDSPPPGDELQFERAEYQQPDAQAAHCAACNQSLDTYYEVGGRMVCPACRAGLENAQPPGGGFARFLRAAFLGLLAGAAGAGLYFAVAFLTGYEFGLIAIVVGFLVGWAVRKGSQARGGWLYQGLAIFLTYSAIVATYMPFIVREIDAYTAKTAADANQPTTNPAEAQAQAEFAQKFSAALHGQRGVPSFLLCWLILFGLAFVTPVLTASGNVLGLIIIAFALFEAWKLNQRVRLKFNGPYQLGRGAPPQAAAGG